jgi:hypothetical protein
MYFSQAFLSVVLSVFMPAVHWVINDSETTYDLSDLTGASCKPSKAKMPLPIA